MGTKLTVKEGTKLVIMRSKKSQSDVSKEMGFANRASLNNMITRGTMKAGMLAYLAECCEYKMVLVPKDMDLDDGIEIRGEME